MTRFPLLILLFFVSLSSLAGCAATLQTTSLPEGVTVKTVAKVDAGAPIAVNRSGAMASVAEGSVRLFDAAVGPEPAPGTEIAKAVETTPVIALGFSPDGGQLAVVFASGRQSIVRCYDLKGRLIAETSVPARVTSLAWRSERELLATALVLKKYSFGTELASFLYRWDLKGQPAETAIYSVTTRPQLAKLPEEALYRTSSMALSPYGDEIAYTVLKDPPLFSPYLRVTLRHLDSGAEKVLAEVAIGSGGPVYTPDGESVLVGNHGGLARRLSLPKGNETNAWPAQGDRIASSPSGSYLLMDGRLIQDGRVVSTLPSDATAAFLPDGSGLAVASNGALFLVTGFKGEKPSRTPREPGAHPRTAQAAHAGAHHRHRIQGAPQEGERTVRGAAVLAVILATLLTSSLPVAASAEPCLPCHLEQTPAAVAQWQGSAHAKAGIGCEKCHGTDHDKIVRGEARVTMKACGPCHQKALKEHRASRHGMGLHSGWGCTRNLPNRKKDECRFCHQEGDEIPRSEVQCARFLKQTKEVGEIGCNYCHSVEESCDSCHSKHMTDLKIVRDPNSCAKCHMGPDHPQWEMWQTSLHGTLNASAGRSAGPDCQSCHMPKGTHNVSTGITMSSGGAPYPAAKAEAGRQEMVQICSGCHAPAFARRELERGDAVHGQSLALLKEAEGILWDLNDRGLLDPMPADRPPHPLSGANLVTDSQMLYEDTSHIERLFFKMKKYDYARTVKGAYHQNPAYTHWYGNAELKMDLVDIKSEASRLKGRTKGEFPAQTTEEKLRVLKNKFERGALTEKEYEAEKGRVLDKMN